MLPKSLDGDSAPTRFQADVPLMIKALLMKLEIFITYVPSMSIENVGQNYACALQTRSTEPDLDKLII